MATKTPPHDLTPAWLHRDRPVPRAILQPIARFLEREIAGSLLLLGAAVVALAWANSPWSGSYDRLWDTEIVVGVGHWEIAEHLRGWVNDLLMALFFYVVGLEIKRELLVGELRDPRAAALPVVAAVGGMVVPALIYFALNTSGDAARGWGVPVATDIAFAVGVLSLFSKRIPRSLVLFLLTLAVADDIGGIIVIAIFYTASLNLAWLGTAVGLLAVMVAMMRLGIRAGYVYIPMAIAVWLAMFGSGVHATIAGVALAFITPARPYHRPAAVSREAKRIADRTEDEDEPQARNRTGEWLTLARLSRQAISPLAHNEEVMHPWTTYLILPLFALANAGVDIGEATASGIGPVTLGIGLGLVAGKTLGIFSASVLAVKTGLGRLPRNVRWPHVLGTAMVGGIGFTVALFVAQLAFLDPENLAQAKIGVLGGSLIAAVLGASILAAVTRRRSSVLPEETLDVPG